MHGNLSGKELSTIRKKFEKTDKRNDYEIALLNDTFEKFVMKIKPQYGIFKGFEYLLSVDIVRKGGRVFPFVPPEVKFMSKIWHTNVYDSGRICVDILQDQWSPGMNFDQIADSLIILFEDPNVNSAANGAAAGDHKACLSIYESKKKQEEAAKKSNKEKVTVQELEQIKELAFEPYINKLKGIDKENQSLHKKYEKYFEQA